LGHNSLKRITYLDDTDRICIIHPTPDSLTYMSIEQIAKKNVPEGRAWEIIDSSEIPTDYNFRNSWGQNFNIDLGKAKEVLMEKIRGTRDKQLSELDLPKTIAEEKGDKKELKRIIKQKNKLRDLPPTINLDQFKTIQELQKFWPEELK